MNFPVQRIEIHGREMAYRVAGSGPVVVLLHGMAGSSLAWRSVMQALAKRCTVVAPDLLGHGHSAKPAGEYSLGTHANVIRDVLAALGHERVTLIGQSFGGGVAMQMAYQFPARCERLVLVSSGGLGREVSGLLRALSLPGSDLVLRAACAPQWRATARRLAGWAKGYGLRPSPMLDEVLRSWGSLGNATTRRAFLDTLRAVIDTGGQTVSATDRLYLTASLPTLIVWGGRDALIPVSHAHAAHAAIPGSRLAIFDDAGHFPHCEAPQRFADTVLDFLDTTPPAHLAEPVLRDVLSRGPLPPVHLSPVSALCGPRLHPA